MLEYTYLF